MSLFAPKPGCPMCSIAQTASLMPSNSPRNPIFPNTSRATQPEILWRDDNFTAYLVKVYPFSSKGHIVVLFKSVLLLPPVNSLPDPCVFVQFTCSFHLLL